MLSLSALNNRINKYVEQQKHKSIQHISINPTHTIIYSNGTDKFYYPNDTARQFHNDKSFVRGVMGPYGSGKSTLCINDVVKSACDMPRLNNRRKSRWAFVRNTSGELQTTTLKTWLDWFGDLGDIHKRQKPILTYEHTFNDGFGIVELEILFIALDRPEDVRKIKSLELTGCYINELSEVPQAALAHMKGRVNRYPSHSICKGYPAGIIADTNPPDEDHWIRNDFELKQLESYRLFKQPAGLLKSEDNKWLPNLSADNMQNLPHDYYLKLAEGQGEDFVKVFCLGEYGTVGFGKRVYPEFSDFHAVENLNAIQGESLYLGWDFGLTPACVVCQLTARGQLMVLKEYIGIDIGLRSFAESVVIPSIAKDFPYNKIGKSVADPAGNNRNEILEEMSCIGELNQLGIETIAARTNDIDPRLGSVRYFLNKMVDGKPAFVIDKRKCPVLYKGFVKDYIYQRLAIAGEERFKDKPLKNMSSHPHDGLGYICLELASDNIAKSKQVDKPINIYNPVAQVFN